MIDIAEADACSSVENIFLGLVEAIEGTSAEGVFGVVEQELQSNNFDHKWLSSRLIAICMDGASVMTGSKSGVASIFINKYGTNVVAFHCLAHRLELAVNDALKLVTATNHFKAFNSYPHYTHYSARAQKTKESWQKQHYQVTPNC